MTFSQVVEQERWKWMPFRQALSEEDQEAFDRMLECAKPQLQAEGQPARPWGLEVLLMSLSVEHEKRIAGSVKQLPRDVGGGGQRESPASHRSESPET